MPLKPAEPIKFQGQDWWVQLHELIHGDSRVMLPQLAAAGHAGTAKVAYLDPPYNTGRTTRLGYRDFREASAWSELISEVAASCRELLRPEGSLWLHINDRQAALVRSDLNEVFGEENFIGTVSWERTRRPSYAAKHIVSTVDPILIYAKDARQLAPFTSGTTEKGKRVSLVHRGNRIQTLTFPAGSVRFGVPDGHYLAGDHSTASVAVHLTADLVVERGRNATPLRLRIPSRYSAARVLDMINEGADFSVPQLPFRPSYTSPGGRSKMVGSLWSWQLDPEMPTHEDALREQSALAADGTEPFPWAKPEGLLRRIIELATEPRELVVDPFAGSGTTAVAAVQTGRRVLAIEERGDLFESHIGPRVARAVGISTAHH
ncbi:DNA methyltransferase [Arthrobacter sp. STN4]|uniref:DNA methyltransferase n=1 Tax=Arthrobacter sp. STN4 TaxID=2923276 RepID=UPI002119FBD5|nr:site-specific DNA-methyltransferase [Arthrobacter sp. STN4]MCQ9162977.1 site-specific DNA-methyltransferase [Arthrobacter sp. STN4]